MVGFQGEACGSARWGNPWPPRAPESKPHAWVGIRLLSEGARGTEIRSPSITAHEDLGPAPWAVRCETDRDRERDRDRREGGKTLVEMLEGAQRGGKREGRLGEQKGDEKTEGAEGRGRGLGKSRAMGVSQPADPSCLMGDQGPSQVTSSDSVSPLAATGLACDSTCLPRQAGASRATGHPAHHVVSCILTSGQCPSDRVTPAGLRAQRPPDSAHPEEGPTQALRRPPEPPHFPALGCSLLSAK